MFFKKKKACFFCFFGSRLAIHHLLGNMLIWLFILDDYFFLDISFIPLLELFVLHHCVDYCLFYGISIFMIIIMNCNGITSFVENDILESKDYENCFMFYCSLDMKYQIYMSKTNGKLYHKLTSYVKKFSWVRKLLGWKSKMDDGKIDSTKTEKSTKKFKSTFEDLIVKETLPSLKKKL